MNQIIRVAAVLSYSGHKSPSALDNSVKAGTWTKPVRIGPKAVGWPQSECEAINRARIGGKTVDEVRELVTRLHAQRTEVAAVVATK